MLARDYCAALMIETDKLRALIDVLIEKDVAEFEHEDESARIKIVRGKIVSHASTMHVPSTSPMVTHAVVPAPSKADEASDDAFITSPFVGTFYRAPSPDTPMFVDVGSVVRPGQTLCIIEAMKLMNEIESDFSGTIVEILAQNGKSVEFGQKLFRFKKA